MKTGFIPAPYGPKHEVELLVQAEKMKGSDRTALVGSTSQHPAVLDGLFNDCYIIREFSSITYLRELRGSD
jgi:hypothetical protein